VTEPAAPSAAASPPNVVEFQHVTKRFGDLTIIKDVTFCVPDLPGVGEFIAILGPSGCGKTTVLRLIAGFETPDAGRILVEGQDVTAVPAQRRRFGMVFQHYALFPHMTAGENVAFGLAGRRDESAARARVAEVLALAGLSGFEPRSVTELSGGQQQRVALARALAPSPRVLLLDEPLSNLDPTLREKTRRELKAAIRRTGITTLFVTHEQEEAFELGDRVAVLNAGRLDQIGTPEELFEQPATRFVATFIGRSTVIPVRWEMGARLPRGPVWQAVAGAPLPEGADADLVIRPEALEFASRPRADALEGEVVERRYAGREAYFRVATESAGEIEVLAPPLAAREGDRVLVVPAPGGPVPRVFPRERA
jgi:ABC-type Fe3+/spermidine/putrescine transport system ATPase subunit